MLVIENIKIICTNCNEKADIMSCRRIEKNKVLITYICPYCGNGDEEIHYLYEDLLNEREKQLLHEGIALLIEEVEYQVDKGTESLKECRRNKLKEIIQLRNKIL